MIAIVTIVGMLAVTGAAFADGFKTPSDIVSGLTGKTASELYKERTAGKTYGTIAKDAGKLDEFQAQMLAKKKAILDQRVKDARLTQKQADDIYTAIKNNQATCDGTGNAGIGRKAGVGFGSGGMGNGMGRGQGMCNGSCSAITTTN
jgi:hypothetical protein